jgi:hypothetical protein
MRIRANEEAYFEENSTFNYIKTLSDASNFAGTATMNISQQSTCIL